MIRDRRYPPVRPFLTALFAGLALLAGCAVSRPDHVMRVVTGLVSHNLCSLVFVSGLDPERTYRESLAPRPGMSLVNWATAYEVDSVTAQVATTIAGGFGSTATYRNGLGCVLVHDNREALSTASDAFVQEVTVAPLLPEIAGPVAVEPTDERLRLALDRIFAEAEGAPHQWTTAVIIVHAGRVVAERYAPGYGVDTPLLGYSATKSVMSALAGIMVRDGRLAVHQPAPVAAWAQPDDPRHAITLDHLLRMTSGLALDETGSPFSPVARMLYLERDMAGYAESVGLEAHPGRVWNYTSGNTLILSRLLRDAAGGHAADVLGFADRELFAPLGMHHVTLEVDATGTPVGSTYMLAPARDWARFAMLYLNDGVVAGHRILPEGWVRYSTTPTLDTGYGAGFWLNGIPGHIPWSSVVWSIPGAPPDSFYARGLLGQYIVIVPSAQLVVARFGVSHADDADIDGIGALVAAALSAVGPRADTPRTPVQ